MGNLSPGAPGADDPLWNYLVMPFISGLVGYGTNVVALKMTFFPIEFQPSFLKVWQPPDQPFGLFGWQGIIPAKAGKMAAKSVDLMTDKLIDVQEVFSRLDPLGFAKSMEIGTEQMMSSIVQDMAEKWLPPDVWKKNVPDSVKAETIRRATENAPAFLNEFMGEVKADIERFFDLKHMVVTNMVANKSLLNEVFMKCGEKELKFIERSGFYFGFLFGLLQAFWWYYYQSYWVLPACGFVVGYATNWLALKVIFRPINPTRVCCFTFHGLFLRRQKEVSALFAQINSTRILTPQAMWSSILHGPKNEEFRKALNQHTHKFVDGMLGNLQFVLKDYLLGDVEYSAIKDEIARKMLEQLPDHIHLSYDYTEGALKMEETLRLAMQGLSSADFESVLHPVFEEDELKLILVGAVLGLAVGVFQLLVLFA